MEMKNQTNIQLAIIGGGASGLFLAAKLSQYGKSIALFERSDRLGKKLSATGNGQGNITNANVATTSYFSASNEGVALAKNLIAKYDNVSLGEFFSSLGVLVFYDERGRGYPTSRQASALTDALRFYIGARGVQTYTESQIIAIEKQGALFCLTTANGKTYFAENVALCTGGKAAKNFGTDGSAYALAKSFGHTLTQLVPSLVQLKTDTAKTRTLKGIRVFDAAVTATWIEKNVQKTETVQGDIIFTDYGVSGDAVFRLSAFIADKENAKLTIDFLPDVTKETLLKLLQNKKKTIPNQDENERLCGIVNNQIGRAILKNMKNADDNAIAQAVKAFSIDVTGTLGFDYAQVTKGGVDIREVDEHLQSRKQKGLYFAGEILDVDGECGGFNLQWAYASACAVADAIAAKIEKR